jgi:beta-galactosidase
MVLPYHFDLDGLNLNYATAQPVTLAESEHSVTYFFVMPKGVEGEFSLATKATDTVLAEDCDVERNVEGHTIIIAAKNKSSWIRVAREHHREIRIYVMEAKEAASLWEMEVGGKTRIVFSPVPVAPGRGELLFFANGQKEFTFRELLQDNDVEWGANSRDYSVQVKAEGVFRHYQVQLPTVNLQLHVRHLRDDKVAIRYNPEIFEQLEDVLLQIEYTGNVGYAFCEGRLFHDHFHNGAPWEIGLARFKDQLSNGEIVLETTPLRRGKLRIEADAAMAVEQHFTGEKIALFHQITAKPVQKIRLVSLD